MVVTALVVVVTGAVVVVTALAVVVTGAVVVVSAARIVTVNGAVNAQPEAVTVRYFSSVGFSAVMTSSEVFSSKVHFRQSTSCMISAELTFAPLIGFVTFMRRVSPTFIGELSHFSDGAKSATVVMTVVAASVVVNSAVPDVTGAAVVFAAVVPMAVVVISLSVRTTSPAEQVAVRVLMSASRKSYLSKVIAAVSGFAFSAAVKTSVNRVPVPVKFSAAR